MNAKGRAAHLDRLGGTLRVVSTSWLLSNGLEWMKQSASSATTSCVPCGFSGENPITMSEFVATCNAVAPHGNTGNEGLMETMSGVPYSQDGGEVLLRCAKEPEGEWIHAWDSCRTDVPYLCFSWCIVILHFLISLWDRFGAPWGQSTGLNL